MTGNCILSVYVYVISHMNFLSGFLKLLTSLAAILASFEAITKIVRFAWKWVLKLFKGKALAGAAFKFAAAGMPF